MTRFTFNDAADIVYASMREGVRKDAERRLGLAAIDPPWCGPMQSPEDRGKLFAEWGANRAVVLYFDRARTQHAATEYSIFAFQGAPYELNGRRWEIVW
jgi:hypothetical protein